MSGKRKILSTLLNKFPTILPSQPFTSEERNTLFILVLLMNLNLKGLRLKSQSSIKHTFNLITLMRPMNLLHQFVGFKTFYSPLILKLPTR